MNQQQQQRLIDIMIKWIEKKDYQMKNLNFQEIKIRVPGTFFFYNTAVVVVMRLLCREIMIVKIIYFRVHLHKMEKKVRQFVVLGYFDRLCNVCNNCDV